MDFSAGAERLTPAGGGAGAGPGAAAPAVGAPPSPAVDDAGPGATVVRHEKVDPRMGAPLLPVRLQVQPGQVDETKEGALKVDAKDPQDPGRTSHLFFNWTRLSGPEWLQTKGMYDQEIRFTAPEVAGDQVIRGEVAATKRGHVAPKGVETRIPFEIVVKDVPKPAGEGGGKKGGDGAKPDVMSDMVGLAGVSAEELALLGKIGPELLAWLESLAQTASTKGPAAEAEPHEELPIEPPKPHVITCNPGGREPKIPQPPLPPRPADPGPSSGIQIDTDTTISDPQSEIVEEPISKPPMPDEPEPIEPVDPGPTEPVDPGPIVPVDPGPTHHDDPHPKQPRPHRPKPEKPVAAHEVGRIEGDPHFTGGDGGKYDVHGRPGGTYNLLSDTGLRVTGEFKQYRNVGTTVMARVGATVTGREGAKKGHKDELEYRPGQAKINGKSMPREKKVELVDGGSAWNHGTSMVVVSHEGYNVKVYEQERLGVRYVDLRAKTGAKGVGHGEMPDGLLGQTFDADKKARNGRRGHGAQGEGAIKGKVSDYEIGGGLFGHGKGKHAKGGLNSHAPRPGHKPHRPNSHGPAHHKPHHPNSHGPAHHKPHRPNAHGPAHHKPHRPNSHGPAHHKRLLKQSGAHRGVAAAKAKAATRAQLAHHKARVAPHKKAAPRPAPPRTAPPRAAAPAPRPAPPRPRPAPPKPAPKKRRR